MRFERTRIGLFTGIICALIASAIAGRGDGLYVPAPSWTYSITSLGTGVATALGISVGSAGGPVTNGGALGTPSSGTATNLSGTAASLTAGSVTTNANLTGEVTSVGNATTIAASARLKSKQITITRDLTAATGSVAYTGMGFQPTACTATGAVAQSLTQYVLFFGQSDSGLLQSAAYLQTGTNTIAAGLFLSFYDATNAGQSGVISSYDSDGLTISWSKNGTPTGTATSYVRCQR